MSAAMTVVEPVGQAVGMGEVPDPQVPERAFRRTYTATYKRDILAEYEACDRDGKGALLRREGLYTSLISAWRDQRDKAVLEALGRSAGAAPASAEQKENARLRKQVDRLTGELDTARRVIEIQSKLSALLDQLSTSSSDERP
jgi:transposase